MSNPEQVAAAELKKRVRYVFKQALIPLRFFPEIWYDFAKYLRSTNDPESCETVLTPPRMLYEVALVYSVDHRTGHYTTATPHHRFHGSSTKLRWTGPDLDMWVVYVLEECIDR